MTDFSDRRQPANRAQRDLISDLTMNCILRDTRPLVAMCSRLRQENDELIIENSLLRLTIERMEAKKEGRD